MTESQRSARAKIREWRLDPVKFVRECFHAEPDPWQHDVLTLMGKPGRKRIALKSCAGPGKAQPVDLMLETPDGLRRWGDLQAGDSVFAPDGTRTRIKATYARGVLPIYRVRFDDRSSTLACGEHLWSARGRTERRHYKLRQSSAWNASSERRSIGYAVSQGWPITPANGYSVLSTEQIIERNNCPDGGRRQFEIPRHSAVEYPLAIVPLDPYVLGAWLGDGTKSGARASWMDLEIDSEVVSRGYRTKRLDQGRSVTVYGIARALRQLGLYGLGSHERFIPEQYKRASIQQRKDVLAGLMDTDGTIATDHSMSFDVTSSRLVEDVEWLVRSLGGVAKRRKVKTCFYRDETGFKVACRDCHRVTVTLPFNPFIVGRKRERWTSPQERYLTRYIARIEAEGHADSMCIEVEHPSECYLTNDFIVTHNTAVLAWAGWHRLACFAAPNEHPKGSAISVTGDNLRDNLWAELARWQNESPFLLNAFQWNKERITAKDHPETWFLAAKGWAKSADTETVGRTLSGQHARYPFYLIDESGDIPPNMIKSAEQGLTSCEDGLIITAGNTTSQTGLLYDVTTRGRSQRDEDGNPLWEVVSITADPDDPKRTPRVDIAWARQQIELYGRENPWVMAYILGLFPPGSIDALLSADDVERAMNLNPRPETYNWAQKRIGVDVARFGDDRTVLFPRQGIAAFTPRIMRHARDSAVSVNIASSVMAKKMEWAETDTLLGEEEILTFFDDTVGWAHGAVDVMRAAGHQVYAIQFNGPANDPRYFNLRAEMWMKMADWIKAGGSLPNIPELVSELSAPTYFFHNGKFQIESKDQIKKRLGRSPDLADALALSFSIPDQPAGMTRLPGMQKRQAPKSYDPYAVLVA